MAPDQIPLSDDSLLLLPLRVQKYLGHHPSLLFFFRDAISKLTEPSCNSISISSAIALQATALISDRETPKIIGFSRPSATPNCLSFWICIRNVNVMVGLADFTALSDDTKRPPSKPPSAKFNAADEVKALNSALKDLAINDWRKLSMRLKAVVLDAVARGVIADTIYRGFCAVEKVPTEKTAADVRFCLPILYTGNATTPVPCLSVVLPCSFAACHQKVLDGVKDKLSALKPKVFQLSADKSKGIVSDVCDRGVIVGEVFKVIETVISQEQVGVKLDVITLMGGPWAVPRVQDMSRSSMRAALHVIDLLGIFQDTSPGDLFITIAGYSGDYALASKILSSGRVVLVGETVDALDKFV